MMQVRYSGIPLKSVVQSVEERVLICLFKLEKGRRNCFHFSNKKILDENFWMKPFELLSLETK